MRELFVPVMLHLAFLVAGAGVLRLAAVPAPRGSAIVGMAGLAYLCGLAVIIGAPGRGRFKLELRFALRYRAIHRVQIQSP